MRRPWSMRSIFEHRAIHSVLKPFLSEVLRIESLRSRCLKSMGRLHGIEDRLLQRRRTHEAKFALLRLQWARTLARFEQIARKARSKHLIELVAKLQCINEEVRDHVLHKFAQRCQSKHCIAFF